MNQMPYWHNSSSRSDLNGHVQKRYRGWYTTVALLLAVALFLTACSPLEPNMTQDTSESGATDETHDTDSPETDTSPEDSDSTAIDESDEVTASESSEDPTDTSGSDTDPETDLSDDETLESDDPSSEEPTEESATDVATTPEVTTRQPAATTSTTTRQPAATSQTTTTTTRQPAATTTRQTTASTTRQTTTAAATPTPSPTPSPTTSPTPSPTPIPQSNFPYKNYGTFFRDQYGSNSQITESANGGVFVDTGSTAQGVVLIRINSSAIPSGTRAKALFRDSGGKILYQYDILVRDRYVGLPLNMGNGQYNLMIAKHAGGTSYTGEMTHSFNVSLASSLRPYTASSIAADFSRGSTSVQRAASLTSNISSADGKVEAVYKWIVSNISYDRSLANRIDSGEVYAYWPDPDKTMSSRKGICFDYAALMCAMLRSQGIPTRMIIGPVVSGGRTIEHAWNEVYFEGRGWVVVAEFSWRQLDGSGWVHFDTTFAAGGLSPESIQGTSYTRSRIF